MSNYGTKVFDILGQCCVAHYIDPDYLVIYNDNHGFIVRAELVDPLIFRLCYFTNVKKAQFGVEPEDIDLLVEEVPGEYREETKKNIQNTKEKLDELFKDTEEAVSQLNKEFSSKKGVSPGTLSRVSSTFFRSRLILQYLANIIGLLETKTAVLKRPVTKRVEEKLREYKVAYNLILGAFFEQFHKENLIYLVKSYLETGQDKDIDAFLQRLAQLIHKLLGANNISLEPNNDKALKKLMDEYIKPVIIKIIQDIIIPALDQQEPDRKLDAVAVAVSALLDDTKGRYVISNDILPKLSGEIVDDFNNIIKKHITSIQDITNNKDVVKQETENYFKDKKNGLRNVISFVSPSAFDDWYDNILKPALEEAFNKAALLKYEWSQELVLDAFDAQKGFSTPIKEGLDKFFSETQAKVFKDYELSIPSEERESGVLQNVRDEMFKIYAKFRGSGQMSDVTVAKILDSLFRSYYGDDYPKKVDKSEIVQFAAEIRSKARSTVDWMHEILSSFPTLRTIYALATYLHTNLLYKIYLGLDYIEDPKIKERIKETILTTKWAMKKIGSIINVAGDKYVYLGTDGDQVLLANHDELLNEGCTELVTCDNSFDFEDVNDQITETLVKCPVSGMIVRKAMLCTSCPYGLDYNNCSTCLYGALEKEAQLKSETPKVMITKNAIADKLLDSISFKTMKKPIKTVDGSILVYDCVMHRKTGQLGVVTEKRVDGSLKVIWASTNKETPVWEQEVVKIDEESL